MKKIKRVKLISNSFIVDRKDVSFFLQKGFGFEKDKVYFLSILEVLFLIEKGKIEVFKKNENLDFEHILKKLKEKNQYLLFKDLKKKGFIVKSGLKYGCLFRCYKKKDFFDKNHSSFLVDLFCDKKFFEINFFLAKLRITNSVRKKLFLAVFDFEKCITYVKMSWEKNFS